VSALPLSHVSSASAAAAIRICRRDILVMSHMRMRHGERTRVGERKRESEKEGE